jgi:hypothetical protein
MYQLNFYVIRPNMVRASAHRLNMNHYQHYLNGNNQLAASAAENIFQNLHSGQMP